MAPHIITDPNQLRTLPTVFQAVSFASHSKWLLDKKNLVGRSFHSHYIWVMVGNGCTKWEMVGDEKWTVKRGRWWNWRVVTYGTKFMGSFCSICQFLLTHSATTTMVYSDFLSPPNNACNLSIRNNGESENYSWPLQFLKTWKIYISFYKNPGRWPIGRFFHWIR